MREIPLTQGKATIVSDEHYEQLKNYKWYVKKVDKTYYAVRSNYGGTPANIKMHVEIAKMMGIWRYDLEVDHRDRNGLNNLPSNIRMATKSQNQQNKAILSNNESGYVGVCFDSSRRKWKATIKLKGKQINIGRFDTALDAALERDGFARKLHGEFATLNFPDVAGGTKVTSVNRKRCLRLIQSRPARLMTLAQ